MGAASISRRKVLLVTECSMSDNVAVEAPNVEFVRPCNLCPHMKRITLPKILEFARLPQRGGDDRSGDRGPRAGRRRAHDQSQPLRPAGFEAASKGRSALPRRCLLTAAW